jgi:uncharacterized protein (TIGR03382 family)
MKRIDWIGLLAVVAASYGCSGGGCDGMVPTPGGFPADERVANAGQIRVSQSGLASIAADPAALLGGLLDGGLEIDVPPGCGGSPAICCPGGTPQSPCGPIVIDLEERPGDLPRMEIRPANNAGRIDITLRARIHTASDLPVDDIPIAGDCTVSIDTSGGSPDDVRIDLPISLVQDTTAGTTRVVQGEATLSDFSADDVDLGGGFLCDVADLGIGLFLDTLTDQFTEQISGLLEGQLCKACDSGDVADCGQFASACTDNQCLKGDGTCLQELGLTGRLIGNQLLASLSPGTLGAFDVYEVAGGYATTNNNGVALGLLGGMLPAGTERDRCGPPATPPPRATIDPSTTFQGNTKPAELGGGPFGIAIGLHESQLDQFAYAAYDGGFLCLTVGTRTIDLLTTDTLALVAGSLADFLTESAPVALGLRPQAPPTITLGRNTFIDDGAGNVSVDDPLLDINFSALELDFFASVHGHYVRLFTLVADVRLPIGLQVGDGELIPVIGDVDNAFTNLSVKNSELLTETPADLAARFPAILQLALPALGDGLGGFELPELGGLVLDVTDITSTDANTFFAIFADLTLAAAVAPRIETAAEVISIDEPGADVLNAPARWTKTNRPAVTLKLPGDGLEWQVRTDGGMWSPWSAAAERRISPVSFWVQGTHRIEVRARRIGEAGTIDATPVILDVPIGSIPTPIDNPALDFHGQAGEGGCDCSTGSPAGGLPIVLALLAIGIPRRRWRALRRLRRVQWTTLAAVVIALGAGPGCSCSSKPSCGDLECMEGEVTHSSGRWNGAATNGDRTVISTYDPRLGDLVVVELGDGDPVFRVADGIPEGETPIYDPEGYRGGITGEGPDVGGWSSIALVDGRAIAAYQDFDTGAVKVAVEDGDTWSAYQLDDAGIHMSIYGGASAPIVAYLVTGVDDGAGHRGSELRLARAADTSPDAGSWEITSIATAIGSCAGVCGDGQACLASAAAGEPEVCVTPSADCTEDCGDEAVCSAGACRAIVVAPTYADLPTGTGLFPTALVLADGRAAVVFYDRTRTALVLLVESGAGSGTFDETILDGADAADRGIWASAVTDGTTIHVAYQDALGDQLYYTTWNGAAGTPELVDDGTRAGDRTHPVGAGASIYLAGSDPAIAYQDGMSADVVVAKRSGGGGWNINPLAAGLTADGFHLAATSSVIAWDQLAHERSPSDALVTAPPP